MRIHQMGKFSNNLVALAIAGISVFGSANVQAQSLSQSMAFCAGAMAAMSDSMAMNGRRSRDQNLIQKSETFRKHADMLSDIAEKQLSDSEMKSYVRGGYHEAQNGKGVYNGVSEQCIKMANMIAKKRSEASQK